ncbi:hypothetical protein BT96DRAFT_1003842 [Gymnopus androsaceus JB14]|uniref:Uncharacterized protein n=1 Tax=Gymnopus androsaceus JB14 TaxID=1447944 RepID=A0A6A4GUN5_9AGAR|nr:hypothetical protein BT96DRAFT_1003842 [Gymnopus androsaceus JB14]
MQALVSSLAPNIPLPLLSGLSHTLPVNIISLLLFIHPPVNRILEFMGPIHANKNAIQEEHACMHRFLLLFPYHGSDAAAHMQMYHLPLHTIKYKGQDVTVYHCADGKMPCACDEEDHACFNYQKLYNPSSNVSTATASTSNSPNAPDPPKLLGSVAADTRGPTNPQEPHSSLPVPIIVPPGLSPGAESTSLTANAPALPSFPGSPRPSLQPVLGFNSVNTPVAPWSPSIALLPSPQPSSVPLTSSLTFNAQQVDPEDVMALNVDLSTKNAEMSTNSPVASLVDFPMANAWDLNVGAGDSMEVDQGTDVQNENELEEEQDGNGQELGSEGEDDNEALNVDKCPEDLWLFLLQYGIQVDPIYNLVVWKHYQNTNQTLQTHLPSAATILSAIHLLRGFDPSPPKAVQAPIHLIAGVKIVNGEKCTVDNCKGHVFANQESLQEH